MFQSRSLHTLQSYTTTTLLVVLQDTELCVSVCVHSINEGPCVANVICLSQ